ncbi:hypothetical protein [Pseudomonas knackmussii]|uniref:hypothetical protein n=1 Tax=Pseudomonas knackmussii TaxID=65741 RepID=UPI003F49B70C
MRNAYGQVFSSVGLDPLPESLKSDSLSDISQALASREAQWQRGEIAPTAPGSR